MKKLKENGITLVALVITIIVLLILASINISILFGNHGLLKRAKIATNEYEKSAKNEQEQIGELIDIIDNPNGKSIITYYIDTDIIYKEEVAKKSDCLKPITFVPEKMGWKFVGWREDNVASGEVLTEKKANSNINLYAVFKEEITLSYNANGGNKAPESQKEYKYYNNGNTVNPSFTLSEAISKSSYTFRHWRLNGTSGTEYNARGSITLSTNATMYASWIANTVYLYNSGNENTSFTGGWLAYLESGSGNATYTTTKQSSNLYISTVCNLTQAKRTAGFKTSKVVDLKGYNKLYVKLRFITNNNAAYYIKSLNTNKVYYMHGNTSAQDITTTNSFNISGNTGLQLAITLYSSFTKDTTGYLYIYQVWATV